jgi:hypothetical protein
MATVTPATVAKAASSTRTVAAVTPTAVRRTSTLGESRRRREQNPQQGNPYFAHYHYLSIEASML